MDREVIGREGDEAPAQAVARELELGRAHRDADVLCHGMDAGVGAASARELAGTAQRALERAAELTGDGSLPRLLRESAEPLPAVTEPYDERPRGRGIPDRRDIARDVFAHVGTHEHILRHLRKRAPALGQGPMGTSMSSAYSAAFSSAGASSALGASAGAATLETVVFLALGVTGSVTSSISTISAASPLRGPSFMMRV